MDGLRAGRSRIRSGKNGLVVSSTLIDTNKGRQTGGRHQHSFSGITTIEYLVGYGGPNKCCE